MIGDEHNNCRRSMSSIVSSVSITAMVSIPAPIATIAMVMVSSIVMMTISMPITITVTIAVMTISMAIADISTIMMIAWRRFHVLDNLHFFVLIIRRHFHKFHTSLSMFRLSMLLALWGQNICSDINLQKKVSWQT